MAITFTDTRQFKVGAESTILNNQASASLSFWFRYESSGGLSFSNTRVLSRQYSANFELWLTASSPNVTLTIDWNGASGNPSTTITLSPGTDYHIVTTWASGAQKVYKNGSVTVFGSTTGNTANNSNLEWYVGQSAGGTSGFIYTLGDLCLWNGTALTQSNVNYLKNGGTAGAPGDPTTLSPTYRWTLAGTTGNTVTNGDSGLSESITSNGALALGSASGSGTAVYANPLSYTVPSKINAAHVGTSGRTIFLFPTAISGSPPASTVLTSVDTPPTISINGGSAINLGQLWNTGGHQCAGYLLTNGTTILPTDTVTISAPTGWAQSGFGEVQSLSSASVTNYVGKSCFGSDTASRTLKIGLNFPHLGTANYTQYNLFKEWRRRIGGWANASSTTIDGYPSVLSSSPSYASVLGTQASNGIDSTDTPGPFGYFAVQWDDPTPNSPPDAITLSGDSSTVVTEVTSLANSGSGGNGKCKVYNVQPSGSTAATNTSLYVNLTCPGFHPTFTNLHIYGPGDFAYSPNTPTSLDTSDAHALSVVTLDRLSTGLGSCRFSDSILYYDGASQMTEPEHLRSGTDFSWGVPREGIALTYSHFRPFSPGSSAYVYAGWFGSAYNVTLSTGINSSATSLSIAPIDSSVYRGQILTAGAEKMRITAVSGYGSSPLTVTVERGSLGTTPASHSSGTITCTGRLNLPTFASMGSGWVCAEWQTTAPHGLITGQRVTNTGNWPTAPTYTAGGTKSLYSYQYVYGMPPVFVTGPDTFLTWVTNESAATSGAVTIDSDVTLNTPTTAPWCTGTMVVPEQASFPYESAAKVAGAMGGNFHVNLPQGCSDALCDEIAKRVRDNFPSGRKVRLELSNETWDYNLSPGWPFFCCLTNLLGLGTSTANYPSVVMRSGQLRDRFKAIFALGTGGSGPDRSGEIELLIGCWADTGSSTAVSTQAQSQNVKIDYFAIAPYVAASNYSSSCVAYNTADIDQACDLWIHDLWYGNSGWVGTINAHKAIIASYNTATGYNAKLYGYEGGYQTGIPMPSGSVQAKLSSSISTTPAAGTQETASLTNDASTGTPSTDCGFVSGMFLVVDSEWMQVVSTTANSVTWTRGANGTTPATHSAGATVSNAVLWNRIRDMHYRPNWYIMEQDMYLLWQTLGFDTFHVYAYCMSVSDQNTWGVYGWSHQSPGRGNKADGRADNRLCMATPGSVGAKSSTTNQDKTNVSVRGLALSDWNRNANYYRKFGFAPGFTP